MITRIPRRIGGHQDIPCTLCVAHEPGRKAIYAYGLVTACQECRDRIDAVLKSTEAA